MEAFCEEYTPLSKVYEDYLSVKRKKGRATVTLKGGWYVLDTDVTFPERIEIEEYDYSDDPVCIILRDGYTLTAEEGIHNSNHTNPLNIYGRAYNSGNLVALWNDEENRLYEYDHSPIGGNGYDIEHKESGGDLLICGGNIYAKSYGASASIGDGQSGGMGNITITGGTVIATGGWGDVITPPRSMRANEISLDDHVVVYGSHMPNDELTMAELEEDGTDARKDVICGNRYCITEG